MKKIFVSLLIILCTALLVYANDIPNADLGIVLKELNNKIVVEKFLPNINIREHSLIPGDIITEIDEVSTENLSLEEIQAKLKGAKGSRVTIKILREEECENFWGKKKTQLVPWKMTLTRKYELDSNLPVRVFKNGDKYNIKMNYQ